MKKKKQKTKKLRSIFFLIQVLSELFLDNTNEAKGTFRYHHLFRQCTPVAIFKIVQSKPFALVLECAAICTRDIVTALCIKR